MIKVGCDTCKHSNQYGLHCNRDETTECLEGGECELGERYLSDAKHCYCHWEVDPCYYLTVPNDHEEEYVIRSSGPYGELGRVLMLAYDQAADGKGKDRHVQYEDEPFEKQQIVELAKRVGPGGPAYQALKKTIEALSLPTEAGLREILGAINYLVGMYLTIEGQDECS